MWQKAAALVRIVARAWARRPPLPSRLPSAFRFPGPASSLWESRHHHLRLSLPPLHPLPRVPSPPHSRATLPESLPSLLQPHRAVAPFFPSLPSSERLLWARKSIRRLRHHKTETTRVPIGPSRPSCAYLPHPSKESQKPRRRNTTAALGRDLRVHLRTVLVLMRSQGARESSPALRLPCA